VRLVEGECAVSVNVCEISVRNSVKNSVSFFGVAENRVKFVCCYSAERFYVWEHDVVGHVLALEFCPEMCRWGVNECG
jgi:hypothetical protein